MSKLIEFKPKESIFSKNINQIIQQVKRLEDLELCSAIAADSHQKGYLLPGEQEKITKKIRIKRLELAKPVLLEPEIANEPGTYTYTRELGQQKPECQMEASRAYYGNHYFIDTPLEIKGRGITFLKKYSSGDFSDSENKKVGWNSYRVTNLAYEKLKQQYTISMECCLD